MRNFNRSGRRALLAAALASVATPAVAQQTAPAQTDPGAAQQLPPADTVEPAGDEVVVTGSRAAREQAIERKRELEAEDEFHRLAYLNDW